MERLPKEILKLCIIVHSTYRTQYTLICVCKFWAQIILTPEIKFINIKYINDIICEHYASAPRLVCDGNFYIDMMRLLIICRSPHFRIIFIYHIFTHARNIIIKYCRECVNYLNYDWAEEYVKMIYELTEIIDSSNILAHGYWKRVRKQNRRDQLLCDYDVSHEQFSAIFT